MLPTLDWSSINCRLPLLGYKDKAKQWVKAEFGVGTSFCFFWNIAFLCWGSSLLAQVFKLKPKNESVIA
jgi:hypothetical protein